MPARLMHCAILRMAAAAVVSLLVTAAGADEASTLARAKALAIDTPYVPPPGDPLQHHAAGLVKVVCSGVFVSGFEADFAARNLGCSVSPEDARSRLGAPIQQSQGAGGQFTFIVPSHELVIVHIGHDRGQSAGMAPLNRGLALLMQAAPASRPQTPHRSSEHQRLRRGRQASAISLFNARISAEAPSRAAYRERWRREPVGVTLHAAQSCWPGFTSGRATRTWGPTCRI